MLRTRGAILDAAQRCVERYGVKRTTMSDIASTAGVAKATLYNHFRAKDDVLAALVEARVDDLGVRAAEVAGGRAVAVPGQPQPGRGLADAVAMASLELGSSLGLRRLAADEPAVLMRLSAPVDEQSWSVARGAVAKVLEAADVEVTPTSTSLVLRHLVHSMLWPADATEAEAGAALLAAGLFGRAATVAATVQEPSVPDEAPPGTALGWPG
jgi:AcrR family transcriptional regulator